MQILIVCVTIIENDAIGNDVIAQLSVLKKAGYEVRLYATQFDGRLKRSVISRRELGKFISNRENVVLYHHGIHWEEGEALLREARCRRFMKYHNITPPEFFENYSPRYVQATRLGREQTRKFVESGWFEYYLADSGFTGRDLAGYGAPEETISVVPPFHRIDEFSGQECNVSLTRELLDGRINVLFVGRMVPNKGHRHIIEVMRRYVGMYGREIRVCVIGSVDSALDSYFRELEMTVDLHNLSDIIEFRGMVGFKDLYSYYLNSHVFLLMSEHEGFCVPILEAQYTSVPVVALDRGAVRETLGKEQIVIEEVDYDLFAAAVHTVARESDVRAYVSMQGRRNFDRYDGATLAARFQEAMAACIGKTT